MNENLPMTRGAEPWFDWQEEDRGLRDAADTLKHHAPLALGVFATCLLAGVVYTVLVPPVYRADTLIQVDNKRNVMLEPSGLAGIAGTSLQAQQAQVTPTVLQGELEILRSRDLLMKAIADTHADTQITIENRFPLIGGWFARRHEAQSDTLAQPALGLGGYAWGGEKVDLRAFDIPSSRFGTRFHLVAGERGAWTLYDDNDRKVADGRVGTPRDFQIDGSSARVTVGALVGRPGTRFEIKRDAPLVVYENLLEQLKVVETARQSGVIRASIESDDRLGAIALLDRIGKSYVARAAEQRTADAERSLKFLEEQLPAVLKDLNAAEEKLSTFRSRTGTIDIDAETRTGFTRLGDLEKQRVELQLRRQQLSQRFADGHPEIRAIDQQLATINAAQSRLGGDFGSLPVNQREFLRLQRDVQSNAALYTALLNNTQQLRVSKAGMTGNATIVDPPTASEKPVRPKPLVALAIAAGLGSVLGIGAAFLSRTMRRALREPDEVERQTGLRTIASIPDSSRQRRLMRMPMMPWLQGMARNRLLTLRAPAEPAVETLRSLFMTLSLAPAGQEKKSILVTSPTGGLGKTFICANLAALMTAPAGVGGPQRRVLLIEADLRRPRLQHYFGLSAGAGLAEITTSDVDFDQVVRRDVLPNLDLLLPGKPSGNPAEALMSPKLRELLAQLELRYDFILIDSAPVLPVGDALAIAPFSMATYLVAQSEVTTPRELRQAIRRLEGVGARVEGVLFNGVRYQSAARGYGRAVVAY